MLTDLREVEAEAFTLEGFDTDHNAIKLPNGKYTISFVESFRSLEELRLYTQKEIDLRRRDREELGSTAAAEDVTQRPAVNDPPDTP
jgi:hypothetical protein